MNATIAPADIESLVKQVRRPRVRKREGRCFELSGETLFNIGTGSPWLLVHGMIRGELSLIAHSWLLHPGTVESCAANRHTHECGIVYDSVLDSHFSRCQFRELYAAEENAYYCFPELAQMVSRFGHWGPWEQ